MSTNGDHHRLDHDDWVHQTRVFLQPIAAPSILGLFAFAASTFVVAANLAGWYGTPESLRYVFPFAASFGGITQLGAAMWAFRARDGVAVALHGTWGSFWIGFGILQLLAATHTLVLPVGVFVPLGLWFFALAVITGFAAIAALGENLGVFSVAAVLAAGAAFAGIYYTTGIGTWQTVAGWVLLAAAWIAAYVAGAMMIAGAWGRTVLPLGDIRRAANVPGGRPMRTLEYELGEPGVRHGQ
jgi:succinate-acetate transporter protein